MTYKSRDINIIDFYVSLSNKNKIYSSKNWSLELNFPLLISYYRNILCKSINKQKLYYFYIILSYYNNYITSKKKKVKWQGWRLKFETPKRYIFKILNQYIHKMTFLYLRLVNLQGCSKLINSLLSKSC